MCSACPGPPAVFPLRVMQLGALLRFHSWLTQVGCPTPVVMVSYGVGVVLVQMSCYPLVFLLCDCAASPSAASPSGFCTLDGCVSMSDSSLLVYSWGWVGGVLLRPPPQGLQRTLFSLLQVPLGFSGHRGLYFCFPGDVGWASALPFFFWASPALLACWGSWGFAPCVRVLQLRCCLLGLQVRSPCCLFPLP